MNRLAQYTKKNRKNEKLCPLLECFIIVFLEQIVKLNIVANFNKNTEKK